MAIGTVWMITSSTRKLREDPKITWFKSINPEARDYSWFEKQDDADVFFSPDEARGAMDHYNLGGPERPVEIVEVHTDGNQHVTLGSADQKRLKGLDFIKGLKNQLGDFVATDILRQETERAAAYAALRETAEQSLSRHGLQDLMVFWITCDRSSPEFPLHTFHIPGHQPVFIQTSPGAQYTLRFWYENPNESERVRENTLAECLIAAERSWREAQPG